MWLEPTAEQHQVRWENLKLKCVPKIWFSIVPQSPACLIQQIIELGCLPYLHPAALPCIPQSLHISYSIIYHYLEDYTQEDFQVTATGHFSKPPYQATGTTCGSPAERQSIHLVLWLKQEGGTAFITVGMWNTLRQARQQWSLWEGFQLSMS